VNIGGSHKDEREYKKAPGSTRKHKQSTQHAAVLAVRVPRQHESLPLYTTTAIPTYYSVQAPHTIQEKEEVLCLCSIAPYKRQYPTPSLDDGEDSAVPVPTALGRQLALVQGRTGGCVLRKGDVGEWESIAGCQVQTGPRLSTRSVPEEQP
jgi:hypothetical protein